MFSNQLLALTKNIGANPAGVYNYRHHENQNHKKNNDNVGEVLAQIPSWFKILEDFYKKYITDAVTPWKKSQVTRLHSGSITEGLKQPP